MSQAGLHRYIAPLWPTACGCALSTKLHSCAESLGASQEAALACTLAAAVPAWPWAARTTQATAQDSRGAVWEGRIHHDARLEVLGFQPLVGDQHHVHALQKPAFCCMGSAAVTEQSRAWQSRHGQHCCRFQQHKTLSVLTTFPFLRSVSAEAEYYWRSTSRALTLQMHLNP